MQKVNHESNQYIKLWNLLCLKLMAYQAFICKSKRIDEKQ